jgi:NAD(P)-dependent dehydrogenase (short-subunit alcohol dehydrogenase family)
MARQITGKVVVVTGASSGIGRATALAFARQGANLVLAARDDEPLKQVAAECEAVGAPAIVVPTDVRDERAVTELGRRAVEAFDRIDVWVNNAGVYMLGKFEDMPPDAFRELYETNLFGTVNGARTAIPYLRHSRGVLINIGSMASTMGIPYGTAYNSSKWAVRGFSDCLREELREEGIDVVTVMPASIDTPLFDHAANYAGKTMKPMDPVYAPEKVADKILSAARRPRPEIMAGGIGYASRILRALLPLDLFGPMMARQVRSKHFQESPSPPSEGNLDQPLPPFAIEGGWRAGRAQPLEPDQARLRKAAFATGAVGLALAALPAGFSLLKKKRRRGLLFA